MERATAAVEAAEPKSAPAPAPAGAAQALLAIQRTAGNSAASRLAGAPTRPRSRVAPAAPSPREAAGAAALRQAVVARSLKVRDPDKKIPNPGGTGLDQTNGDTIQSYLQQLCTAGAVTVDPKTGVVALKGGFCDWTPLAPGDVGPPTPPAAQLSKTPAGCGCLCDIIGSSNAWTIVVDDADWPHTDFDDHAKAAQPGGTGGQVTAPSPNSTKLWGAGTASGGELDIDPWLVLGHELCGHGWLGDRGLHGPDEAAQRGEGGHQETVKRENLIRAEHGIEARGGFKDPNCGESYFRDKASPKTTQWSRYRAICIKWREAYNKKNKTSYKITDRIP